VLGTWIFSKRRAVAPCKRVVSSASVSCASTKASGKTDVLTAYTRDSVGDHVVLPGDMTDICRELGYKIEIVKLPWAALVASLAEGVGQRLVVGEGQEVPCFKHMTEMLDSLVDSQQLSVVGAILSVAPYSFPSGRMLATNRRFEHVVATLHPWLWLRRLSPRRWGRQDTGGPGVVLIWCTVLWRTSFRTPEGRARSGNSANRSST